MLEPVRQLDRGRDTAESRRLAWLLLYEASGSERLADDWCDSFAEEVVERLPADVVLVRDEITSWLDDTPSPGHSAAIVASACSRRATIRGSQLEPSRFSTTSLR